MADSSYRNVEDLNLDEITEEFLENEAIRMGIALDVDIRQGSLYRDAADGHIIRTAKFFDDLRYVAQMISMSTTTGDVLTEWMRLFGLSRNPAEATPARYYVTYNGAEPKVGDIVTVEGHMFTVESVGDRIIIVSDETGTEMNRFVSGTIVLPQIDIDGLISCTLGDIAEPALDPETDDAARERLIAKCSGPAENGNMAHVQLWCESVEGVGRARIIPIWKGPQTVKAIIIDPNGRRPTDMVIEAVQEYVDPGIQGMGEGAAAIGEYVTVVGATEIPVDVSVKIIKSSEYTKTDVQEELKEYLTKYFKSIAMQQRYQEDVQVRYQRVAATIMDMPSVVDLEDLFINGEEKNLAFSIEEIPILGEVTVK